MILSHFGKLLIEAYNLKHGTAHNPRSFFDDIFYKQIYYKEPFLNRFPTNSVLGRKYRTNQQEGLLHFHDQLQKEMLHGGLAFGLAAKESDSTTSGQVTSLDIRLSNDDAYCSWIADALSIELNGMSVLIDDPNLLLIIQEGWGEYREWLENLPSNITSQQIRRWNGLYLRKIINQESRIDDTESTETGLKSIEWCQFILSLSTMNDAEYPINLYVYNCDQTNKTIGFIQVKTPQIRSIKTVYEYLVGKDIVQNIGREQVEKLYTTEFNFLQVCQRGYIGLNSLEPKGLHKFNQKPTLKLSPYQYPLFIIWLTAMLNKQETFELAEKFAQSLANFWEKANPNNRRLAENICKVKNLSKFREELTKLAEADNNIHSEILEINELTYLHLTFDQIQHFLTLTNLFFIIKKNQIGNKST